MEHLAKWERSPGHFNGEDVGPRNAAATKETSTICPQCDKVCKSKAGLRIHVKRIHEDPQCSFECRKRKTTFNTENTMKNHIKTCGGNQQTRRGFIKCQNCQKEISKSNAARHRRTCQTEEQTTEINTETARKYRAKMKICPDCGMPKAATNMARHRRTCKNQESRGEGIPFDPGVNT